MPCFWITLPSTPMITGREHRQQRACVLRVQTAGLAEILGGLVLAAAEDVAEDRTTSPSTTEHAAEDRADVHPGVIGRRVVQCVGASPGRGIVGEATDDPRHRLLDRSLGLR